VLQSIHDFCKFKPALRAEFIEVLLRARGRWLMNRFKQLAYAGLAVLPNPGLPVSGAPVTLSEVQDRIQQIAQFLIIISMVIAVAMIVWGAVRYMVTQDAAGARKVIFAGIIGAAVVLGVGVILQTTAGLITRSFFS